jgi:hypothetical protein
MDAPKDRSKALNEHMSSGSWRPLPSPALMLGLALRVGRFFDGGKN